MENLAERYSKVKELHSLWLLLRKRIEEELTNCGSRCQEKETAGSMRYRRAMNGKINVREMY